VANSQAGRGRRAAPLICTAGIVAVVAAGCAGAGGGGGSGGSSGGGGGGGGGKSVNVLMVNNPQMLALQKLTADNFTKQTGIKVNYTVLPENDVRDKISQEFSSQAGQYDVASLSNYEIPFYSKNGWLSSLSDTVAKDPSFDQADILKPMAESLTGEDGKIYGEPFYGESSFLMYRKDLLQAKGITMPAKPTWQDVATIAAKLDGAKPGMKGICLRGLPGWGEVMAPLTTVWNTFGGAWWDKDWNTLLTDPATVEATKFYANLIQQHGESGAAQSGFAECLNNVEQSKTAMWYDATSAAGSLEGPQSPVKTKMGYAPAPVVKTPSSGWLYSWAWGIQKASKNQDAAVKFITWASGKDYENLVGKTDGWATVPAGKRASTYSNPDYLKVAKAFAEPTKNAIDSADPKNPGVQPRPAIGIQFVAIPEFSAVGTTVSQSITSAIAGKTSVESALQAGQAAAQKVADKYKNK
jgi:sorbitol/mannitol transport system substrate-binding protein